LPHPCFYEESLADCQEKDGNFDSLFPVQVKGYAKNGASRKRIDHEGGRKEWQ
jgi:hypothetical protein